MTVETFPKIPETPMVDKNGSITPAWRQFFLQLLAALARLSAKVP